MRICISGTNCVGKSTLVEDFIKTWPDYKRPADYRDIVKKTTLSKKTNEKKQQKILDLMQEEASNLRSTDKIIFDRGPLDNLVYTLWANQKGIISDEFVQKTISVVKESIKKFDIIFFIPLTNVRPFEYVEEKLKKDKKSGTADEEYRTEIDYLFKALKYDWDVNNESKIFDPRDKPALIEIFGSPHERIEIIKLYLDADGDLLDNVGIVNEEDLRELQEIKDGLGIEDVDQEILKDPYNLK